MRTTRRWGTQRRPTLPRLYIVAKDGGPWMPGTYVEENDGMLQAVRVRDRGGRLEPGGYMGFVIPMAAARPYVIRIQKTGLDEYVRSYSL